MSMPRTFATLSPIPGFVRWLQSDDAANIVLPQPMRAKLKRGGVDADNAQALWKGVATDHWNTDPKRSALLEEPMLAICSHYLTQVRQGLRPVDPVARFHLDNGARIERLNWLADTSAKGLKQSAGIMVNYLYELDEVERNHEAFVNEGRISVSRRVEALARALRWPQPQAAEPAAAG